MTAKEMRDWLQERLVEWGFVCEPIERARQLLEGKEDDEILDDEAVRRIQDWFGRLSFWKLWITKK